jgi:hypothetical protein
MTPVPEDFLITDGFYTWQQNVGIRIQEALSDILNSRYIVARAEARAQGPALSLPLPIKLRIVEARGLLTKESRTRDPFCHIEFGNLDKRKDRGTKLYEEFSTQIVNDTLTPRWNQHVDLEVRQWEDKLSLEIWDKRKDQFLGRALISISDIINLLETEGTVSNWFRLEKHPKHKDKYVGGEIFLEFHCERAVCFFTCSCWRYSHTHYDG